jgi:cardiolipin synthase
MGPRPMDPLHQLIEVWEILLAVASVRVALDYAVHPRTHQRDSRAATLWLGFIWLLPLLGALLYFVLGINRIKRRAMSLRAGIERYRTDAAVDVCSPESVANLLPPESGHLVTLAATTCKLLDASLLPGNRIEPLEDGDSAYPSMLEAIAKARHSIALSTYIFDNDPVGKTFAKALGDAVRRGVDVRVLVDATGLRYSWPSIVGALKAEGVPHARFMRTFPLRRLLEMNLRNHRKILVVDGRIGFAGGLNIREGHWLSRNPVRPIRDLQFRIEGPVVAHLQETFADDWHFTTGEALRGDTWFPELQACGSIIARGIPDGPDEDFEKMRWTFKAALAAAKNSVRLATPYFLPEPSLISSLNLAALRGVEVDILLPARNNLPFVHWASQAMWWQVLERGCRLWLSPPPFDHSKLLIIDDSWTLFGSTNWDPRSLRLNFEFNVECYDRDLARGLVQWFDRRRDEAHQTSLAEVDARPLPIRVRDGAARLLSPFL